MSNNRAVGEDSCGGGISANGAESTTVVNTVIKGNSATDWGVGLRMCNTVFTVTNSLFISNTGGSILDGSEMTGTIVNVTVADNTGVGVWVGGAVTITNSIMWGHGESDDYRCDSGCTLAYSDVGSGDTTGTGNISADPRFVDAANGDYHLGVGSPGVDKGTLIGAPTHDIEGTLRDAVPDMGAYEWAVFRIFLPLTVRNVGS